MTSGFVNVCIAPLKREPTHHSEMTSQLLFGEGFSMINKSKDWYLISCNHDQMEAWINETQVNLLNEKEAEKYRNAEKSIAFDVFNSAISKEEHLPIVIGSDLPQFDGLSFKINKEKIVYNGQVILPKPQEPPYHLIEKICLKYLKTPYLWGGRSPFGIDASGFTQMVYKFLGIGLGRQIEQQSQSGTQVDFLSMAREGDLLICETENELKHIGIYLDENRIIHCYGKVKIDLIDAHGIFDQETKSYSHKLVQIRRYF